MSSPCFLEDNAKAYIFVLFLFYNASSNSLKIGNLHKKQMVTIKVENVISWSISSISGDQHSAGIMLAVAEALLSPSVMH